MSFPKLNSSNLRNPGMAGRWNTPAQQGAPSSFSSVSYTGALNINGRERKGRKREEDRDPIA